MERPAGGSYWWVTPSSNPRYPFPSQIVTDPTTGEIAVWSSGDPFLDGAYFAAEVLFGQLFDVYVGDSGGGLFISEPQPRQIPD
ncbi:MAG TPA: hypothetical protein VF635_17090 [Propionibacteriaceae bacterium]|jgi:hypothetical protein